MKFSLETIAKIITDNTNENVIAEVEHIYEDYGAGLMWDTVVVRRIDSDDICHTYQALSPRLHDMIVNGHNVEYKEIEELIETANRLMR